MLNAKKAILCCTEPSLRLGQSHAPRPFTLAAPFFYATPYKGEGKMQLRVEEKSGKRATAKDENINNHLSKSSTKKHEVKRALIDPQKARHPCEFKAPKVHQKRKETFA